MSKRPPVSTPELSAKARTRRVRRRSGAVVFEKSARRTAPTTEEAIVILARERFEQAQTASTKQRQRELDALRFYAGDQWLPQVRQQREGQDAANGLPAVPARPCLTINKVREPVRQVVNVERDQDFGAEIVPADDFGDLTDQTLSENEIRLREGLVRRIQRASDAKDARIWGAERAAIAGVGCWGVLTRYLPGKTWDQEVYVRRIYNQAAVSWDPMHTQPDASDAEWAFERTLVSRDEYKTTWPKVADGSPNPVCAYSDEQFQALGDEDPNWFTSSGDTRTCVVVDYWRIERVSRTLCLLDDGSVAWKDDVPDGRTITDRRTVVEKQVKWVKMDGIQILEETDWPSPFIPLIKVLGEELQPYDNERRAQGMVEPAIDSGRGFNYMVSKLVEQVGLAPLPPWMMAEGQDEGYEQEYLLANTRTLPSLHYKQKDLEGNPVPGPPTRTNVDTPIAPITAAIQLFDGTIRDTTGVPLSMNGNIDPSLRSAKAIKQMLDQGSQGTSNYQDNLKRSIAYEAKIINSLLPAIYGRAGRMARIINGQGEPETLLLHQPFVTQGVNGSARPVPVPPAPQGQPMPPGTQLFTFTEDAAFNIAIKVSKAYDTRREQEASNLGDLIAADPQQMAIVGDLYFKYQDGPGHEQLAERYRAMLAPPVQALLAGQGPTDPKTAAAQAALQAAQQKIQQLEQDIKSGAAVAQIKAQADAQQNADNNQTKIKVAIIQQLGMLTATDAKLNAENARTVVEAVEGRAEQMLGIHADKVADLVDKVHQHLTQDKDHAHEAALAATQQAHDQSMAQLQQTQATLSQAAETGAPPNVPGV